MMNIICFGDSITESAEIHDAARWTSLLQNRLDDYKPGYYQVCNKGVDGNTSAQGFDRYWTDVMPLLPGRMALRGITLDQFLSGDNLHLSLQGNREYAEMIFAELNDMDL